MKGKSNNRTQRQRGGIFGLSNYNKAMKRWRNEGSQGHPPLSGMQRTAQSLWHSDTRRKYFPDAKTQRQKDAEADAAEAAAAAAGEALRASFISKTKNLKNRFSGMTKGVTNRVSGLFGRKPQQLPNVPRSNSNLATAPALGGRRTRKNYRL